MVKSFETTASMQFYEVSGASAGSAGLVPLYAVASGVLPSVYQLTSGRSQIGRDEDVAVRVDAQAVSRKHALIYVEDGIGWKIIDLQSRNGTLVNGKFIRESRLQHMDELRIGDAIFKFIEKNSEAFQGYRYDGTMEPGASRRATMATSLLGGAQMDYIVSCIERIASTMLSVIIRGESGTGKEVAAREIHRLSGRRGNFVAVNCAAIPAPLLESELFGYRRGAFSGADRDKIGLIKAAHGGTLFLDEIGDMPLEAQAKLLRVLQAREVMPIGATTAEAVDVRVVCATHRDLAQQQAQGQFRGDLYARLQEYVVWLPPLRDRKEDIYLLSKAFLARMEGDPVQLSFPFLIGLLHYNWPFNVRELEACLKRAVALSEGSVLGAQHLPESLSAAMQSYGVRQEDSFSGTLAVPGQGSPASGHIAAAPQVVPVNPAHQSSRPGPSPSTPSEAELRALLSEYRGNVAAVGRVLGKERMQIHRWMKRYGIEVSDYRAG
jgi:sigma-54 dependent transcriptional regulator, acetoin dehydrogenase operon transcriptional activator AcoR